MANDYGYFGSGSTGCGTLLFIVAVAVVAALILLEM